APQERLQLAVEHISVRDAALSYSDASTGQSFDLSSLNLELSAFNLQGAPFNLDLDWQISIEDQDLFGTQPMLVGGELSSRFQLAEDMSELHLNDGRLGLDLSRAGASGEIELGFAMSARNLLEEPSYQGELRLSPFNPRALMAVLSLPELETKSLRAL